MEKVIYPAPAIKCGGCANTIEGALRALDGVREVHVDVGGKRVSVNYDPSVITDVGIRRRLTEAGFPPAA
jgi:copper chaperone CopZ